MEVYDLAFCWAEIHAARAILDYANKPAAGQEVSSKEALAKGGLRRDGHARTRRFAGARGSVHVRGGKVEQQTMSN